jgi:hypothetical protein
MSAGFKDPAIYAQDLSFAAGRYASHIGNLAFFATCPASGPLRDKGALERSMREGVHDGSRRLSDLLRSPSLGACLARVGREPREFRIRLEASRRDALELTTILVHDERWGRHVDSWGFAPDRLIAERVAEAGIWFRDLALALEETNAVCHKDHAPLAPLTPAANGAAMPAAERQEVIRESTAKLADRDAGPTVGDAPVADANPATQTKPPSKRRGRQKGVNYVNLALTELTSRMKDGQPIGILDLAQAVGCTSENLHQSKRFIRNYRLLTRALARVPRGQKRDGEVEAEDPVEPNF